MIKAGPYAIALLLAACAPANPDNISDDATNIADADVTEVQDESTQGNAEDEGGEEAPAETGSNRN